MATAASDFSDKVRTDALQLVTMSAIPGAVAALARLNIFQALGRAGDDAVLTVRELAALALPGKAINITYLARLLRLMAAKKVLREVVAVGDDGDVTERRYALEPIGRFLVDEAFLPLLLTFQSSGFLQTWEHIHESVLDDSIAPFTRAHGVNAWEYFQQNPELGVTFNKAMAGHSEVYMRAVLDVYRGFEHVNVLVDVGGGFGSSLRLITAKYPHVKGINFDLPQVIGACPPLPAVEHVSGDMFKSVPSGDAIFMKHILHDWDDESCITILKNCHQALPEYGKVIAVNHVLPEIIHFEGGDHMAVQGDIHMLAFNPSGACERTERDFRKLGLAAGFKQVQTICTVDNLLAVTEFHKTV
ncbi:hypothetical protein KC19_5G139200 [Ceratodon purpureus]|uniref:O-methyltransferase n=1 Tax=Ceratodon purpureus TaxID=3225 RepID=A0A8T0I3U0_CERPU|nr:hypothetical protein KC19_5G139200 [Ceratodon purpureus]KAG0577208.1 hypothetical protein KC19_5G139200 [Ceratodon purpureus]KAG0577209.1 hypothetical protein KC19_5G139200 [Ceratodon purpureus]